MTITTTRGPLSDREIDQLANFNAEVARGIAHTPEWVARMQNYQQRWYDHHANVPGQKKRRWVW